LYWRCTGASLRRVPDCAAQLQNVVVLAGAVTSRPEDWAGLLRVVRGGVFNVWNEEDLVLKVRGVACGGVEGVGVGDGRHCRVGGRGQRCPCNMGTEACGGHEGVNIWS
jgi:hypothetical protein